jgi:hypothetical protein
MATFLDVGLTQHFSVIFPILLVFVLVFALLEKTKLLGENKGLNSIVALCLAIMMLFIPGVVDVIAHIAPWFVLILFFLIMLLILLMAMGTKWETITKYASGEFDIAHWIILILLIIVFLGALGVVYGNTLLPYSGGKVVLDNASDPSGVIGEEGTVTDTGDFNANVGRVIFHPKVLGFLLIMMIGALSIKFLSVKAKLK